MASFPSNTKLIDNTEMEGTTTNKPFSGGFDLRHRLKLSQEGKDDDLWYVTHLSISPKQDIFAAGGPQGSIKLFKMDTLLYCGDFKAHEKKITGLEFCHNNEHCFWTTSADSTLNYWDTRKTFKSPIYRILSSNNCPFTACGLNCSDETVAAATEPYGEDVCLYLWDTRQLNAQKLVQRNVGLFTDCHNREITQITFNPLQTHQMASGSLDGLICLFDVSKGTEDDCLDSVLNTGSSVSQIGFYGPTFNNLYCLTHIETLQLWNIPESTMTTEFTNPREENGSGEELNYFIDCAYHQMKDQLFFIGGTHSGRLHVFHVKDSELETVCPLMGGHTAIVRCLEFDQKTETILTGGEDSIISCWKPKEAESTKLGKVVSGAVAKLKVHGNKPYEKTK
ncbi:WD repeat-containing protein 89-like [Montipora foliosa]|uniref:WD repeat-containing protein 89-like n=1 Tax=Montipora foliosa TaxID=591990 RepID=UPI0035F11020